MTNIKHNKQHNWNICEKNRMNKFGIIKWRWKWLFVVVFAVAKVIKILLQRVFLTPNIANGHCEREDIMCMWGVLQAFFLLSRWHTFTCEIERNKSFCKGLFFWGELMYIKGRYISIRELFVVLTILWHYRITKLRH